MDTTRQAQEVDRNYEVFQRLLPTLLSTHRDQYALMRDGEVVDYFDKPGDANRAGHARYADHVYSIQEVSDEPIDLGFFSHVAV